MTITANLTGSSLKKLIANRAKVKPLVIHAVRRSANSGRTAMARDIAADMRINVTAAKEAIRVGQVTESGDTIQVSLFASAKRIPLIDFGARGPEPSRGKGRGVSARTKIGRYPHAFITRVGVGGHRGVFQRRGKTRLPIYQLFGASIAHVFVKHSETGMARAKEQLAKNLRSNLRFFNLTQSQES